MLRKWQKHGANYTLFWNGKHDSLIVLINPFNILTALHQTPHKSVIFAGNLIKVLSFPYFSEKQAVTVDNKSDDKLK